MRRFLPFIIACGSLLARPAQAQRDTLPTLAVGDLRTGDLLFAVNATGNAITAATAAAGEFPIDHVGIFLATGEADSVLEATPRHGVWATSADGFLAENPACVVGRIDGLDANASLDSARRFLGLPYDSLYEAGDSAIYCSELVQKSYVDTVGRRIFETIPMSFHDSTGATLPYWAERYRRHGRPVPEGAPGSNPGQQARSQRTRLVGWLRAYAPRA